MKILILANHELGLYCLRKDLIAAFLQRHEVYISLPRGELTEHLTDMGCIFIETPVDRRGINPARDLGLLLAYRKMVRDLKPDLVITYTIKPNIYGGLVCRVGGIPYAVNITGLGTAFERKGLLQDLVTVMYRVSLGRARVIFTENTSIRDFLVQKKICREDRLHVLHGAGVNLEHFFLQAYPDNRTFIFLFIGRVMKEKGVGELLLAMRSLRRQGKDCVLHVVGFSEEDYRKELEQAAREGWLVDFGYQKDVRPFIGASDCQVLPSWHEGMANTNLECASSGRPVITSDIPGCREAVRDGETGFLCRVKDAESLEKAMAHMMDLSREERERMGLAGRRLMQERFDKKAVVEDTLRHLFPEA